MGDAYLVRSAAGCAARQAHAPEHTTRRCHTATTMGQDALPGASYCLGTFAVARADAPC